MKKKKKHILLKILGVILALILIVISANGIISLSLRNYAKSFDKVEYTDQLIPALQDGQYSFTTDKEFKVMQITDVHLGSGMLSVKKDKMALNAIAAMVSYEKPDLVIVTGDISFPVPYIAGTFNDKVQVKELAALFETLGVYWTVAFGNHDSEAYSLYNREKVASFYENKDYKHCIFTNADENITGNCNQVITIKNSKDLITKALFVIDSNAYLPSDPLGVKWEYDNVHEDQISWYENKVTELSSYNKSKLSSIASLEGFGTTEDYEVVSSFIFQHIPVEEFKTAYHEYVNNNNQNTLETTYNYGVMGEDPTGEGIFSPMNSDDFFERILAAGSTEAMFFGHDHLNNISLTYKGITLAYGYSIDYLAYADIEKYGAQRGCSLISINKDTSWNAKLENYYQDKYVSKYAKESVTMDPYYAAL